MLTKKELEKLFDEKFPGGCQTFIDVEGNMFTGHIVWLGFSGMSPKGRTRLISERIRRTLGERGVCVGIILPFAPDEKIPF